MASDEPQPDILDLLYDDELDEETRAEVRRGVESSEGAREELDAFESMLSRIREADVDEEVPSSVHDSIMAAARQHAGDAASRQAQVTKRAPTESTSPKQGLWGRLHSSGGARQLMLAAAVVLVGGFVFVQLGDNAPEQRFMSANTAVDSQVTFGGGSRGGGEGVGSSANKFANFEPSSDKDKAAEQPYAQPSSPTESAQASEAAEPAAEEKHSAGFPSDEDDAEQTSALGQVAKLEPPAQGKAARPKVKRRARKSAARSKAKNDTFDLFRPSSGTDGPRRAPAGSAEDNEAMKELVASADDASEGASASAESNSSSKTGVTDGADLGDRLGALADSGRTGSSSAPARKQSKTEGPQERASSVSTMEENYRSGNYAGVVSQADRYLAGSTIAGSDEARVLELKARALAGQGKASEADETYARLQDRYPSYKPDHVRRARAGLNDERQRKSKAPAESREVDEAAPAKQDSEEMRPSSIE